MHLHILGICGTFMGGVALLARELGHDVSGSDARVYPPMSTQLETARIRLDEGYDPANLRPAPDLVVVGNALSRGNPAVEYLLDAGIPYTSGPQWLAEHVLPGRWVLAVSGTHGKTTTSSLLAHLLEEAGLAPGFLIGGVAENFGISARLGRTPYFVVEADEYDTAFFDKRSKFLHYRPRTLIINNLEFDHADIFPDLASIQRQFEHLLRTVPGGGLIVKPHGDGSVETVIARGCWTPQESFGDAAGADWRVEAVNPDGGRLRILHRESVAGETDWPLIGRHNARNAAAAVAAAHHAGVPAARAVEALAGFRSVKRRLEHLAEVGGVNVYDDFAHHPTAIALTLEALRSRVGLERIVAVFEPRSNSMRLGVYRDTLGAAFTGADETHVLEPEGLSWDLRAALAPCGAKAWVHRSTGAIVDALAAGARAGDHIVLMSNGGFEGIHGRLIERLRARAA